MREVSAKYIEEYSASKWDLTGVHVKIGDKLLEDETTVGTIRSEHQGEIYLVLSNDMPETIKRRVGGGFQLYTTDPMNGMTLNIDRYYNRYPLRFGRLHVGEDTAKKAASEARRQEELAAAEASLKEEAERERTRMFERLSLKRNVPEPTPLLAALAKATLSTVLEELPKHLSLNNTTALKISKEKLNQVAGPVLKERLLQGNSTVLSSAVLSDVGAPSNLSIDAVMVPSGNGDGHIKFEVKFDSKEPDNPELFKKENYGLKEIVFADPDGVIVGTHKVEIAPPDKIRPPVNYDFANALSNAKISSNVSLKITNMDSPTPSAIEVSISSAGITTLPAAAGEGCWSIEVSSPGFETQTVKVMNYKGLKRPGAATEKLLLIPKQSLAEGSVRVVLSWGDEPQDLDLYCKSSEGRIVYYGVQKQQVGEMMLDIDVRNGHGPETVTVNPKSGVSYYFYVHHFSGSKTLATSSATLRVYGIPGITQVDVPSGFEGAVEYGSSQGIWQVFMIDGSRRVTVSNKVVRWTSGAGEFKW